MKDLISRQAVLKLLSTMPPEEAMTKALLIQSVKQMDAPDNLVKDSQGLAKDLVNDTISRSGVSAWLANMGYSKLADVLMDKNRFPSAQPETHDKRTETHACDLIDRQMAIDGFYEMASDMDYLCTVSDYVSFLESLPSAQPEQKKGKWIAVTEDGDVYKRICSCCGREAFFQDDDPDELYDGGRYELSDFCPHCGADMREVNE